MAIVFSDCPVVPVVRDYCATQRNHGALVYESNYAAVNQLARIILGKMRMEMTVDANAALDLFSFSRG